MDLRKGGDPAEFSLYREVKAVIAAHREKVNGQLAVAGIDPTRLCFNYELSLGHILVAEGKRV